jgi:hypothetical protein
MKTGLLFYLFLMLISPERVNYCNAVNRWVVESNSSLIIEGRSNITAFRCEVTKYLKADTLDYYKNEAAKQNIFNNSCLTIDINDFDCHQRFITADFRKTLKADQCRWLKIHFISMDIFDAHNRQQVKGKVEIILAGISKVTTIDFIANPTNTGVIQMNGAKTLTFSDFNLTPPRKLAGFIRIEEAIKVNFQLFFKPVE